MLYPIAFDHITKKLKYYNEVIQAHNEATEYINSFYWCLEIKKSSLYTNLGRVLCIFLFDIVNTASEKDNLLWVIVGDLPPMYLDVYGPTTTIQVLEDYAALAEDWITEIKTGGSIDECYPFKADATIEMAELLETRVDQIKNNLIPNIENVSLKEI